MAFRVDRYCVAVSREARSKMKIQDTLSFVEDGEFLTEFRECGLGEDDLEDLQIVITVVPSGGEVVPVTKNIRDVIYVAGNDETVVIRYVHLPPSTVLLLTAFSGDSSHPMTAEEATIAERYIAHQTQYFATRFTR
jgi:hypothetical protein